MLYSWYSHSSEVDKHAKNLTLSVLEDNRQEPGRQTSELGLPRRGQTRECDGLGQGTGRFGGKGQIPLL